MVGGSLYPYSSYFISGDVNTEDISDIAAQWDLISIVMTYQIVSEKLGLYGFTISFYLTDFERNGTLLMLRLWSHIHEWVGYVSYLLCHFPPSLLRCKCDNAKYLTNCPSVVKYTWCDQGVILFGVTTEVAQDHMPCSTSLHTVICCMGNIWFDCNGLIHSTGSNKNVIIIPVCL